MPRPIGAAAFVVQIPVKAKDEPLYLRSIDSINNSILRLKPITNHEPNNVEVGATPVTNRHNSLPSINQKHRWIDSKLSKSSISRLVPLTSRETATTTFSKEKKNPRTPYSKAEEVSFESDKSMKTMQLGHQATINGSVTFTNWKKSLVDISLPHDKLYHDLCHLKPVEDVLDLSYWKIESNDMEHIGKCNKNVRILYFKKCIGITDAGFSFLLNFCNVIHLDTSFCSQLTDTTLLHIQKHMSHLEVVNLSNCPLFTEAGFVNFIRGLQHLRTLIVQNFDHLRDAAMQAIGNNISNRQLLTKLDVSGCKHFSDESLLRLLDQGCRVLKELYLDRCHQISDLGLMGLKRRGNMLMEVRHLNVAHLNIHDSAVNWISEGCKFLRSINIEGSLHVTEDGLVALGMLEYLKDVNLSDCVELTPSAFRSIFYPSEQYTRLERHKSRRHLTSLNITRCILLDDDCLFVLSGGCTNLQNLVMVGVCGITDTGLQALAHGCHQLRDLNLAADTDRLGLTTKSRMPRFTTAGIAALACIAQSLRSLVLISARRVYDSGFQVLAGRCVGLESLQVQHCLGFGDKALTALGTNCSRLVHLDLTGCKDITDHGMQALKDGCLLLKKIVLVGCMKLTDASVCSLIRGCSAIQTLSLMNCISLTDAVLEVLAQSICRCHLITLNLRGLPDISDCGVLLLKSCPNLTALDVTFCDSVTASAVYEIARALPFAQKLGGGRKGLGPLPVGVRLYNRMLLDRQILARASKSIQKNFRRYSQEKKYTNFRETHIASLTIIQRFTRRHLWQSKIRRLGEERRLKENAVSCIQKLLRHFLSSRLAMAAIKKRQLVQSAAMRIQLCWISSKYRHAAKYLRRRRAYIVERWGFLCQNLNDFIRRRAMTKSATYCQRIYRENRLKKMRQIFYYDAVMIQCAWRCHMAHVRYSIQFFCKYQYLMSGVLLVQRYYRRVKRWEKLLETVVKREQEWVTWHLRKVKVAYYINDFCRAYLLRKKAKEELARRKLYNKSAHMVQRCMRVFLAKTILYRSKTLKLQIQMRWKSMLENILNLGLHRSALKIQREFKTFLSRKHRDLASRKVQRAYRGFRGRSNFFDAILHYRRDMAQRIQGAWRAFMAKNILANLYQLNNRSACILQRTWRRRCEWQIFKMAARRIIAEKAEAHRVALVVIATNRTEEFARKLLEVGFDRVVRKIQSAFRQHVKFRRMSLSKFLDREKRFRRMKDEEDRRNAANRGGAAGSHYRNNGGVLVSLGWSKSAQQKLIESKTARIRKDLGATIEEESTASKILRVVKGQTQTDQELRELAQAQQLSVLNRQSRSVQQEGIVDMKFTVGKVEHDELDSAMQEIEKENRGIKRANMVRFGQDRPLRPVFRKIDRDLTGKAKKNVYLWIMSGSGKWVWSSFSILRPPTSHTNAAANKSRINGMREAGFVIINHLSLDIEIQGYAPLAIGKSGSALDSIILVRSDEDWSKVKDKGFVKFGKHLGTFGLQKGWYLAFHKKEYRDQPILHQVTTNYLGAQGE